jgi:hypothetical protein
VIAAQDSQVGTLRLEGKSALLGNLTRVDVQRQGRSRVALIDGTAHTLPTLTHPDELVKPKASGPAWTSPDRKSGPGQSDSLLPVLLGSGPGQSNGQSGQSREVVQWSSVDQSGDHPDRAEIAAIYKRLGSKNQAWLWLRDNHGIRRKETAYRMIDAAIEQEQERYRVVGE